MTRRGQSQRLIALLCVVVAMIAASFPGQFGQQLAAIVPVFICVICLATNPVAFAARPPEADPRERFLTVTAGRAPPRP